MAFASLPTAVVHAQSTASSDTQDLQNALRRIARNSNDSSALADAGLAALSLGDTRAAIGFLAKADQLYPRSGRVKAGLARALLLEQNPFGAIRYFDEAVANGVSVSSIAADRGLSYDLIGRNEDAQRDYELAMRSDRSDELLSRYAISLGISGNVEQADAKLDPLLQKSDRSAWRNRAFILAMNGKTKDANEIARQTMQKKMARAIKPFFDRMPKLTSAQKAAAIHFGHFPASENIGVDVASVQYAANSAVRGGDGADAGLIPLGEPLGSTAKKPRVLAMPDTSARRRPGRDRAGKRRNAGKKPVEIVVLDQDSLPSSAGRRPLSQTASNKNSTRRVKADSREGRRLLKKAAREGSEEAKAYLREQSSGETEAVESAKVEPSAPSPDTLTEKSPAVVAAAANGNIPAPGFETSVAMGPSVTEAKSSPRQIAAIDPVKAIVSPPVVPSERTPASDVSATDTPLVSASVERKVGIGSVPAGPMTAVTREAPPAPVAKPAPTPTPALVSKPTPSIAPNQAATEKPPTQLVSFDLANSLPTQTQSKPPVQLAQAEPERRPLADIIGSISIPDAEKKTDVVPVDLGSITPATARSKPQPETKKEEPKKPEVEVTEEKHPKRYWVQIATGSNLSALKYDFRQMKKKNSALFGDMNGWTSPWGNTKRMVIGPFDELSDAKKFDSEFRQKGGDSFAWVSSKGTEVTKLP